MENSLPSPKIGRRKKKTSTEPLKLRLDATTARMLEELEMYGRIGTTKQEIVMHILRTWLWENEARLRAGIASKDKPLSSLSSEPR